MTICQDFFLPEDSDRPSLSDYEDANKTFQSSDWLIKKIT